MATPEGRIKTKVSAILKATPGLWYNMPVPGGYGTPSLDYVGCFRGLFFAIETKRPGAKPTPQQEATIARMRAAGAAVFVIDGSTEELEQWLNA